MKQSCPKCKTLIEINEKEYAAGSTVVKVCPLCDNDVTFSIPGCIDRNDEEYAKMQEKMEALEKQLNEMRNDNESNCAEKASASLPIGEYITHAGNVTTESMASSGSEEPFVQGGTGRGKQGSKQFSLSGAWEWGIIALPVLAIILIIVILNTTHSCSHEHSDEPLTQKEEICIVDTTIAEMEDTPQEDATWVLSPMDERLIKTVITTYFYAESKNDSNTLEQLFTPIVERYNDSRYIDRNKIIHERLLQLKEIERENHVYLLSFDIISDFQIDVIENNRVRVEVMEYHYYDNSAMTTNFCPLIFIQKFFILNRDYQIVSLWDGETGCALD